MAETLVIIGVGLVGGSIGLAARRTGKYSPILGVDRDPDALERARLRGCIDEGGTDLPAAAKRADVMVFCTPVDQIAEQVLVAAKHCRSATFLTDVGSTKVAIVDAVEKGLSKPRLFFGAHPLAGSEKCGPENARADLFDGRMTIITPTERTMPAAIAKCDAFWSSLGCRIWAMRPDHHDEMLALTSHLPHLTAAALAGLLLPGHSGFAATGFRDTTRLAAGDPGLWTAIFMQNSANLARHVGNLQTRLDEFRKALLKGDSETIRRLLTEAKGVRDDLGN